MDNALNNGTANQGGTNLFFHEYVAAYEALLKVFLSYTPAQVGSGIYASRLTDLEEAHPDHADRYDQMEEKYRESIGDRT
jgi:hypothetical protein